MAPGVRGGAACGVVYGEFGVLGSVGEGVGIMSEGCFAIIPDANLFERYYLLYKKIFDIFELSLPY